MAKLTAILHGQEIASLTLEAGKEYTIGRGSDCSIQLPNEKGISRQHMRIIEGDGTWTIELLSKVGSLILEGENVGAIELSGDCRFSVPPFEFVFETTIESADTEAIQSVEADAAESVQEPVQEPEEVSEFQDALLENPQTASGIDNLSSEEAESVEITAGGDQTDASEFNADATAAGVSNLVPTLKVKNEKTGEQYTLKLDGNIWTAGRMPDCEIHIPENAISRKHFEIALVGNSYSIKDLGSSNGTHVNGRLIETDDISELNSGDKISIRHISILFEVRDKNYEKKLAGIKELVTLEPSISHVSQQPTGMEVYQGPAVMREEAPRGGNPMFKKALMIGAPLLLVIAIFFSGGKSDESSVTPEDGAPPTSQADLDEAKHLLEVAKNHYVNQNFSFCVTQLKKLHKLVPSYQESLELKDYCEQAIELEKEQADAIAIQKNKEEVQAKIQSIIDNCEAGITPATTSLDLRSCMQPALDLNPEEPRALTLIANIETNENQALIEQQGKAANAARAQAGKRSFSKAVRLEKSGKLKSAKSQYYKFIRGNYGLRSQESKARRSIASIDKSLTLRVTESVKACEKFLKGGKYKEAIKSCDKALAVDSKNSKAISTRKRVNSKIRLEMSKLWDESILEENFGNVESAKAKWKEIKAKSYPKESYYKKARNKLKSYGIE